MSKVRSSRGGSPLRVLPVVLVAGTGLFLAVRGATAVQTALRPTPPSTLAAGEAAVPEVQTARSADKALVAVVLEGRDPLHRPRRPVSTEPTQPRPVQPEPLRPPTLRMVMVDTVNPLIQLYDNGEMSPRLQAGDVFHGWTVVSIGPGNAVVSKDGESFTVTLGRNQ